MQLFIVQPNLKISDCDNCPSDSTLITKKHCYLKNLSNCKKIVHSLSSDEPEPSWCMAEKGPESCPSPTSPIIPTCPDSAEWPLCLPLQSINLTPSDFQNLDLNPDSKGEKEITSDILFKRLNIPKNLSQDEYKWLAVKYLQLISDISLLDYKYLKSFVKINKIIKKYFSKTEVSKNDEEIGFKCFNHEKKKFKKIEHFLILLLDLKKKFNSLYSDITIPEFNNGLKETYDANDDEQ